MPFDIKFGAEYSVVSQDDFGKRAEFRLQVIPVIPSLVKNPFGFFAHTFFFKVGGERDARIARIKWTDNGFVGDNHQTWHALGLVRYRWPGWGVHWNLQAGYRALRVFDFRTYYDAVEDVHAPNVMPSVDF